MDLSQYTQNEFNRGKSAIVIVVWDIINKTLFHFCPQPLYFFKNFLLRLFGAEIGKNVKIRSSVKINYPWKVSIGDYSWIGEDVVLYALDKIKIGKHSVVSQKSHICTGSHDLLSKSFKLQTAPIIIQDHVWVQADVFIGLQSILSTGCVILSRSSYYGKTTEPWSIYVGNPAKFIKKRIIE
jgi:putative colanic acid biosynthesis acetyltransferase WcaF